jgi:hypothetical protein
VPPPWRKSFFYAAVRARGHESKLADAASSGNAGHLLQSISAEVLLGLVVLIAAGLILQFTPPAMAGMQMGN